MIYTSGGRAIYTSDLISSLVIVGNSPIELIANVPNILISTLSRVRIKQPFVLKARQLHVGSTAVTVSPVRLGKVTAGELECLGKASAPAVYHYNIPGRDFPVYFPHFGLVLCPDMLGHHSLFTCKVAYLWQCFILLISSSSMHMPPFAGCQCLTDI